MDGATAIQNDMSEQPPTPPEVTPRADVEDEAQAASPTNDAQGEAEEIQPHRVVEAILFAADSPLPPARLASIMGVGTARDVKQHIASLNAQYAEWGLSFRIEEIAGGFQMMTLPAFNGWLRKLLKTRQESKLSPAALETLAIIAYKQPCTRAEIETIRGVAAGDIVNRLREMNLVKIVGRAEDLGRPLLYGTTRRFLEVFGLPSLEDLPRIEAPGLGLVGSSAAQSGDDASSSDADQPGDESTPSGDPPSLHLVEGDHDSASDNADDDESRSPMERS